MKAFWPYLLYLLTGLAQATDYPVTVRSCDRDVTFTKAPVRAVSHDVNLTEMLLALGLQDHMAGYTGVTQWKTMSPVFRQAIGALPELAEQYPTVETLLDANADFLFAGWNYGMQVGGPVTPERLAPLGIPVYELTESCAHVMRRRSVSLEDVYTDIINLGLIFNVEGRATTLVEDLKRRHHAISQRLPNKQKRPRVLVYDSGEERPFTAGRLAMPSAIIAAAGGQNVLENLEASWTQIGWESVVALDPEVFIIVDYGAVTADQKIRFLEGSPALAQVTAIRNHRFVVLPYDQLTPGVANLDAIEALANALNPTAVAP